MIAQPFSSGEHQDLFCGWWRGHHGIEMKRSAFSKTGVAVLDGTEPVAIAYLYPVIGSEICWIGFTARDPQVSAYKAGKALKLLISGCEQAIRMMGYTVAYATYDASALHRLAEGNGFSRGSDVREYFKELR